MRRFFPFRIPGLDLQRKGVTTVITEPENPAENSFPIKVLAMVLILSVALFIGLGWYTWNSYRQFKMIQERDFRLQELAGIIIHLDEVLTMSARMAAATGDVRWEERYRNFEPKLDAAIKESIRLAPEAYESESAAQTDAANIKLVEMENQAFVLVREGEREVASKLLLSGEYQKQKGIYAGGMQNIRTAIKNRVESNLQAQRRRVFAAVAAIVMALPALIFSWIGVLRTVRGHLVQKARLYEKTQHNLERMRALHEIGLASSSTLDLHAVLNVLMEKIDLLLPYTAVLVWLRNRESGQLERAASWNLSEEEWKGRKLRDTPSLVKEAVEGRAPVVARNVQTDPRTLDPEFYRRYGLVSYLGVPLLAKGEVLGVLVFLTREEHEFTEEEVEFLSTLAGQAAIAIHNSQLYELSELSKEELESTNQRLLRSLGDLASLYATLTPLDPSGSVNQMLEKIIDRLMEATGADAVLVRLQDKVTGAFSCASDRGFPSTYLERVKTIPPGSALDRVFHRGEAIIAADIAADPRLKGKVQLEVGFHSCAFLPLRVGLEVRGIVHLASRELGYFNEEKEEHLMAIARQMGIAMENRELLDETKNQASELEKANKVKDEFLGFISHELRTPLNVVMAYTEMMKDGMLGEINPEQEQALGKIKKQANELLNMIGNLLEVTRIEAGAIIVGRDEVPLVNFLDELRLDSRVPLEKELTLHWDYPSDLPLVRVDSEKLKHILQNIINNAIKFTARGSVKISARCLPGATAVEFKVADTGIGIPKESLSIIFERFRQVDGSQTKSSGGVGLGLHIVKKFTEMLEGKIEVESEPGKGSTFTVTIPSGSHQSEVNG